MWIRVKIDRIRIPLLEKRTIYSYGSDPPEKPDPDPALEKYPEILHF